MVSVLQGIGAPSWRVSVVGREEASSGGERELLSGVRAGTLSEVGRYHGVVVSSGKPCCSQG